MKVVSDLLNLFFSLITYITGDTNAFRRVESNAEKNSYNNNSKINAMSTGFQRGLIKYSKPLTINGNLIIMLMPTNKCNMYNWTCWAVCIGSCYLTIPKMNSGFVYALNQTPRSAQSHQMMFVPFDLNAEKVLSGMKKKHQRNWYIKWMKLNGHQNCASLRVCARFFFFFSRSLYTMAKLV